MKGWTQDRIELAIDLWKQGMSAASIAAKLGEGLTRSAVIGFMRRRGVQHGAGVWAAPKVLELKRLFASGLMPSHIAIALDMPRPSVEAKITRLGLKRDRPPLKSVSKVAGQPAPTRLPEQAAEPPLPRAIVHALELSPVAKGRPTVLTIRPGHCKFGLWSNAEKPHHSRAFFCGEAVVNPGAIGASGSYCAEHHARCIAPDRVRTPSKRPQADREAA